MSIVISRIIGGLGMMVVSILLLIAAIVLGIIEAIARIIAVTIMAVAMFVAGAGTMFGIDKLVDLCENVMDKVNEYINDVESYVKNEWD